MRSRREGCFANDIFDSVIIEEHLGIYPAACAQAAIGTNVAMHVEDSFPAIVEKAENHAQSSYGLVGELTRFGALAATMKLAGQGASYIIALEEALPKQSLGHFLDGGARSGSPGAA